MATLELTSLDCVRKQDVSGSDEPRIKVDGDVVWNGVMNKGATRILSVKTSFTGSVAVELEEMNGTNAKQIGATAIIRDNGTPGSPVAFKTSGAHYDLHFEVS
jgi:hypothetical protein